MALALGSSVQPPSTDDAVQLAAHQPSDSAARVLPVASPGRATDVVDAAPDYSPSLEEVEWNGGGGCVPPSPRAQPDPYMPRVMPGDNHSLESSPWILGIWGWDRSMKVGDLFHGYPITWLNPTIGAIKVEVANESAFFQEFVGDPSIRYCEPEVYVVLPIHELTTRN